jgi:hypothetical protein
MWAFDKPHPTRGFSLAQPLTPPPTSWLGTPRPWSSPGAGPPESKGNEFRRGSRSVSPHPITRTRGEHHDRYLHLRHLSGLDGYGSHSGNWGGHWGEQGPELIDHRLASYGAELSRRTSEARRVVAVVGPWADTLGG